MAVLVLLAGLGSAILVRFSPGALVDERELDQRMSPETLAAMRNQRAIDNGLRRGLSRYFQNAMHGDLGKSQSYNAPITKLLLKNAPPTLRRVGIGLAGAWFFGLWLAIPVAVFRSAWMLDAGAALFTSTLLSLPAGVLAYLSLTIGAPVEIVLLLVLTPRVFRFARNVLVQAYGSPHVDMARARGINEVRILITHVFPGAAPQLLALVATSLSMAVGAIIPIEAICDAAGLGRLAWQAAIARDLPLLLNLTMLIALATTAAMAFTEVVAGHPAENTR
jgi:ABC-type dipeptide/oligopeptide/nickel transport system permease component